MNDGTRSALLRLGILLGSVLLAIPTLLAPVPMLGAFAPPQAAVAATPHASLTWSDYPTTCRGCHDTQFSDVYQGLHYQWQGVATDNVNKPGTLQGKATNAMNAYCISTLGNWKTCGKCHPGRGAQPVWTATPTDEQLDNIDCLVCHSEPYAMARVRLPDGTMGPPAGTPQVTLDGYVRNIATPNRANCLKCHAFAGGGDGVKRGDISAIQTNTADGNFDVHMSTTRGDLACQACHTFIHHKVTGKGSDLESTDYASEVKCATSACHPERQTGGHATSAINSHVAHVACQTCHVPVYGKVPTEVSRDWRVAVGSIGAFKPTEVKGSNLTPKYKWWNRKTSNYVMGDSAVLDPATGAYSMERLQGSATGDTTNKIYPFKYKIAYQPMRTAGNILVALDTSEYLNGSGDYAAAVTKGLANMGFSSSDAYTTVKTDTYQLLNHTIADAQSTGGVLKCADCHENTARMDLKGQLGYNLKAAQSTLCVSCHERESWPGYSSGHRKHVTDKKLDCVNCHTFSRPERGLKGAVPYSAETGIGTLNGTVTSGGSPLSGVSVSVPGFGTVVTASDGSYSRAGITSGTYGVTFSKSGYATVTRSVTISANVTTTTDVSLVAGSGSRPVYRFFNKRNGSHFYTASESEKETVVATLSGTYSLDGVSYHVADDFASPLYRFYNKANGSHFYTASSAEKNDVQAKLSRTYSYDGIAYYVSATATQGSAPVHRFYNKQNGSHFYTASASEKRRVEETLSGTYSYDGVAFHVAP